MGAQTMATFIMMNVINKISFDVTDATSTTTLNSL